MNKDKKCDCSGSYGLSSVKRMQDAEIRTRLAVAVHVGLGFVSYYYCGFLSCKLRDICNGSFRSLVSIVSSCLRKFRGGGSSCKWNA